MTAQRGTARPGREQEPQPASRGSAETPLFARYFDLCAWLIPCVEDFPRVQRFLLGSRLLDTAFACHALLIRARKVTDAERAAALLQADVELETLRLQWRLAHELKCMDMRKYEHGAGLITEVGRMLGKARGSDEGKRPAGAVRVP